MREASRQAIGDLKALGIARTVLVSGDNCASSEAVGRALGVDEVHGEMLPQDKLAYIRGLQAEGHRVAFVGDGVNDAPALAAADVLTQLSAVRSAVDKIGRVVLEAHLESCLFQVGVDPEGSEIWSGVKEALDVYL